MVEKRERRRRDGSTYTVWRVRWYDEAGAERSKTFDRATDAKAFEAKIRTLKRTGALADVDAGRETLAEFVEEWWMVYAGPNLERATLRAYASLWNGHALPRLGQLQLRELTPQTIARFRAELEAAGVGVEAIRKTMTMLQGVLQRAVEWGRVPTNAVKITRKPPKPHRPAVQAIPPTLIELMRARLLEQGKLRDATLLAVLAYAGLRPQEALALEWRHVRERTLLVERALSDGQLKALKNRRQPRTVELLAPLRDDLAEWRRSSGSHRRRRRRSSRRTPARSGARVGLAQLAQAQLQAGGRGGRHRRRASVRPAARVRVAAHPRGSAVGRRDRGAARPQPDGLPGHLRARDGRAARGEPVSAEREILLARGQLATASDAVQLELPGVDG